MGKKSEKILELKKENKHLRKKIIELEKQLAEEKAKRLARKSCDPTKGNTECNCRLHRAYRNYYMTHASADSYEVWLRGDKPVLSPTPSVSESTTRDSKREKRSVNWQSPVRR